MPYPDLSSQTFRPAEGFYTSEVQKPRRLPVRTFLPTGYEPRYPYPLLVFFHGHGGNEEQILHLAPRLSRRNYICLGLRGPQDAGRQRRRRSPGLRWGSEAPSMPMVEDYVFRAVELTGGVTTSTPNAFTWPASAKGRPWLTAWALEFPEKFGGVISLNGAMSRAADRCCGCRRFGSCAIFIGHGIANAMVPLTLAREDHRLLYTAGLNVEMQTYPATHRLHPDMLRDINRWMMNLCNEEQR